MARPWEGFFIRGLFALLISIGLFLPDTTAKLAEIYIGFFFVANGVLSLKVARRAIGDKRRIAPAIVSIIGGFAVILLRLSSPILALFSLPPLDIGRYLFGPITVAIGLFQVMGRIRVTPDIGYKLLARSSLVLGILEILLGIVALIYAPVDWQVKIIAHLWIIVVMLFMLSTAHRLRNIETKA